MAGELMVFLGILFGEGIHHYEKGKKECNQISIGDEPSLKVLAFFFGAFFSQKSSPFLLSGSKNETSFMRMTLGLSPMARDITPSLIISR